MKVYNTLSRQKEEFQPAGEPVKMYVCGVTPYDTAHVGHAMSYVIFDMIRRYLEYKGYRLKVAQNFTDIDDKIIARAQRLGVSAEDLAERYIDEYLTDMDALAVKRADVYPRATQEIDKIIKVVQGLIDKGMAYESGGDVYYRVSRDPGYGKLSGRSLEEMEAGARVEPGAGKEYPMDFTLWKAAKPGEPHWPSPWGEGRPGWHIECTAMVLRYLGEQIDIHGGGQDLIFPHHENEIAQSESYTGLVPFARYWFHNGLLQLGEQKMSKSLGNLVTVREALEQYGADALRLFILTSHYRNPLTYSDEALEAAVRGVERLRTAMRATIRPGTEQPEGSELRQRADQARQSFEGAMDDDFNSPAALAQIFDLARDINRAAEQGTSPEALEEAKRTLAELAEILGFTLAEPEREKAMEVRPFVDLLVELRQDLRRNKQYQLADRIRQQLAELGITLEDRPEGTVWRFGK